MFVFIIILIVSIIRWRSFPESSGLRELPSYCGTCAVYLHRYVHPVLTPLERTRVYSAHNDTHQCPCALKERTCATHKTLCALGCTEKSIVDSRATFGLARDKKAQLNSSQTLNHTHVRHVHVYYYIHCV